MAEKARFTPCPRCGVIRRSDGGPGKNGKPRTGLCRDCFGSLKPKEREEWAA